MGTATWVLLDNETSTGVTLRLDDSGVDASGGDTDSPPPNTDNRTWKRAIVIHEVPQVDYDVGQDMGLSALKRSISAKVQKGIRDQLVAWMQVPGYTTNHPAGRFSITSTTRDGITDMTMANAVLESLVEGPAAGQSKWWKITLSVIQTSPNQ
jgi:hypothetical protein